MVGLAMGQWSEAGHRVRRLDEIREGLLFLARRWESAAFPAREPATRHPLSGEPTARALDRMRRALRRGTVQYLADTLHPGFAARFLHAESSGPDVVGAEGAWKCLLGMAFEVEDRDVAWAS